MDAGGVFVSRFNLLVQACLPIDIPLRCMAHRCCPYSSLKLAPEAFSCILPFLDLILASTVYLELIAAELIVVDRF